MGSKEMNGL